MAARSARFVSRLTVIGENAEDDARRYYRTRNGVVVVNRDMLGQERQYQPDSVLYG